MKVESSMRDPLRVAVLSKQPANSGVLRLRLLDPLLELERRGELSVSLFSAASPDESVDPLLEADVWVIQREMADPAFSRGLLPVARRLGIQVVYDIDDLLVDPPPGHMMERYLRSIRPGVLDMLRSADRITVSTEPLLTALEDEMPSVRTRASVLPNAILNRRWPTPISRPDRRMRVVGWSGSPTHDQDLAMIRPALEALLGHGDTELHVYGALPRSLRGVPGVRVAGPLLSSIDAHAARLCTASMDLAIAPLVDDRFNRCKSDVKWLEHAAAGLPSLCSDVGPYSASIAHGVDGWLTKNDSDQWLRAMGRLLDDPPLRRKLALGAIGAVRGERSIAAAADQWLACYQRLRPTRCPSEGDQAVAAKHLNEWRVRLQEIARSRRVRRVVPPRIDAAREAERRKQDDPLSRPTAALWAKET